MGEDEIARIAAEVSLRLQLDRLHGLALTGGAGGNGPEESSAAGAEPDLGALANVPEHLALIFEAANEVSGALTPAELWRLVNRRLARLEAQLYLTRLQLESAAACAPGRILEDPLVVAALGERVAGLESGAARSFHFDSAVLAHGWYPIEHHEGFPFRWMRPLGMAADGAPAPSVAGIPHLGQLAQEIEIEGNLLDEAQYQGFGIAAAGRQAEITRDPAQPHRFTARLRLERAALPSPHYLPVTFRLQEFRRPGTQDTRLLGASIRRFTCRPLGPA